VHFKTTIHPDLSRQPSPRTEGAKDPARRRALPIIVEEPQPLAHFASATVHRILREKNPQHKKPFKHGEPLAEAARTAVPFVSCTIAILS